MYEQVASNKKVAPIENLSSLIKIIEIQLGSVYTKYAVGEIDKKTFEEKIEAFSLGYSPPTSPEGVEGEIIYAGEGLSEGQGTALGLLRWAGDEGDEGKGESEIGQRASEERPIKGVTAHPFWGFPHEI